MEINVKSILRTKKQFKCKVDIQAKVRAFMHLILSKSNSWTCVEMICKSDD